MNSNHTNKLKPLGLLSSFLIFGAAAILLLLLTKYFIPFLATNTGLEVILCWFIVAGLGVFLPLIIAGLIILKLEGYNISASTLKNRLRFTKTTGKDWAISLGGLVLSLILSGAILKGLEWWLGDFDTSPPFMSFEPLTPGRYWILVIWAPYWLLNILGEEFLWRGVMLPRQEMVFGNKTWLIHGLGWSLFHIAFGWQLLITMIPLIFIQSYVVQKTKNSWTGVIMHAGINGPSFIAIALGAI
jgi:membrane protease YdiL (CAAX protease family)